MFAEVIPNLPLDTRLNDAFTYAVPSYWPATRVQAGHLVVVPFGKQRVQGIVVAMDDEPPLDLPELKEIDDLVDEAPVLTREQLDLAYWLAREYQAPLISCLTLMLPPGLSKKGDARFALPPDADPDTLLAEANTPAQARLLKHLIAHGTLRGRQLQRQFKRSNPGWRQAADQLVRRGLLTRTPMLAPPSVSPKQVKHVVLAIPPEDVPLAQIQLSTGRQRDMLLRYMLLLWPGQPLRDDLLRVLARVSEKQLDAAVRDGLLTLHDDGRVALAQSYAATRQALGEAPPNKRIAVLDFLLAEGGGPLDVGWVYAETGASISDLRVLVDQGLVTLGSHEFVRDSTRDVDYVPGEAPPLTPEQRQVWQQVQATFDMPDEAVAPRPILLHGVTGSGKTEIYLRAVAEALARGQQAFILVPEIALTPQTVKRFLARFPGRVAIVHSELSDGERYDTWRRAREGRIDVVVGVRSALFTPLPNPGLIVLDEEHDESYKQSPNEIIDLPPYYHARDAAVAYARRTRAVCILGSATPDLVSYTRAKRGAYTLLEMPRRIMGHGRRLAAQARRLDVPSTYQPVSDETPEARYLPMPRVDVVDMRQELRANNRSMFSRLLQREMSAALARREQVILFLNRRGSATYVFCRDCGYHVVCPRCETPMAYHSVGNVLVCNQCGTRRQPPATCPACDSTRIRYFGVGTQKVESAVHETFPDARTLRWDRDTTREKHAHARILDQFAGHHADVLVGTQMVAKGLDLPLVTLVGVISADTGLVLPDFRAAERTFQLLAQVAGRAGRGLRGGRVVVQSYMPDHYAITTAAQHDYQAFYDTEMGYRRTQAYPPYLRLARLLLRHHNNNTAESEAGKLAHQLRQRIRETNAGGTTLIGPAPAFFGRVGGYYRWHIIVRGPHPADLLRDLPLPAQWTIEPDPLNLL